MDSELSGKESGHRLWRHSQERATGNPLYKAPFLENERHFLGDAKGVIKETQESLVVLDGKVPRALSEGDDRRRFPKLLLASTMPEKFVKVVGSPLEPRCLIEKGSA